MGYTSGNRLVTTDLERQNGILLKQEASNLKSSRVCGHQERKNSLGMTVLSSAGIQQTMAHEPL